MRPESLILKGIFEFLKNDHLVGLGRVIVSLEDEGGGPLSLDISYPDGKTFRLSIEEIVKIDRSREILEMTRKIKAGMSKEDIQKFFDLQDEHHGKPK